MEILIGEMMLISKEDMLRTAAWMALIANGEVSDYDLRRNSEEPKNYADGDAKKLQLKMQLMMTEIRKQIVQKRAETN